MIIKKAGESSGCLLREIEQFPSRFFPQGDTRFSKDDIQKIEELAAAGLSRVAIARQFNNVKPSAIRSLCARHDIRLRKTKPGSSARFAIPSKSYYVLSREAGARGMSVNLLGKMLLEIIARDGLVPALLDHVPAVPDVEEPAPTPQRSTVERPRADFNLALGA